MEDLVLALEKLDGLALTHPGHVLRLAASPLPQYWREEDGSSIQSCIKPGRCELADVFNREYPTYLGSVIKGDVESVVSNFFD